jgi:hypothetical protein
MLCKTVEEEISKEFKRIKASHKELEPIFGSYPDISYAEFGSSATVQPTPKNSDVDIAVFGIQPSELSKEWEEDCKGYDTSQFISMRKGDINLVVFLDKEDFLSSISAAALCKRLNLKSREDRIAVFDVVRENDRKGGFSNILHGIEVKNMATIDNNGDKVHQAQGL